MKAVRASYAGIVLVLSVLLVFAACRGTTEPVPSAPESGTVAQSVTVTMPQTTETEYTTAPESTTAEGSIDVPLDTTAVPTTRTDRPSPPETTTAAAVTTEKKTEPASETTLPVVPEETTEEDRPVPETTLPVPTDTAEIVQIYNTAINRAVDSAAKFTKTREVTDYQSSKFLDTFRSKIYNFMGIGQTKTRVIPGDVDYDHYLQRACLTAEDVDNATCTVDAYGKYHIDLNIKDGKSKASKNEATCEAPLDRSGIAVGKRDKSYWDHKTAENIYASMEEVLRDVRVEEKYTEAKVEAVVRPDGSPESVEIRFHDEYNLYYGAMSGWARMDTQITFEQFSFAS